jgi:hypothetical protein
MRMYKRRLWQQRGQIVLVGALIWATVAAIIITIVQAAS